MTSPGSPKTLTRDDIRMLEAGTQWMNKHYNITPARENRPKRFPDLIGFVVGMFSFDNRRKIKALQKNVKTLYQITKHHQVEIIELAHWLNITYGFARQNRRAIIELNGKLHQLRFDVYKAMTLLDTRIAGLALIQEIQSRVLETSIVIQQIKEDLKGIEEYMRIMATNRINPFILPPNNLRKILQKIQLDLKNHPRLGLPDDADEHVWSYYSLIRVNPIVTPDFLVIILTIPLIDHSLTMNIYKVHNLPALDVNRNLTFTYILENEYLAVSSDETYVALPSAWDIRLCEATAGHLCTLNQALYPTSKTKWCILALYQQDVADIKSYCKIDTERYEHNRAQSLGGYLWAISAIKRERIQVRCPESTTIKEIKPPLTIVTVEEGCEAYSPSLYIPAKSELSTVDNLLARDLYFEPFTRRFQNLSQYRLTLELANLSINDDKWDSFADTLTRLPPMTFKKILEKLPELVPDPAFIIPNWALLGAVGVAGLGCVVAIILFIYKFKTMTCPFTKLLPAARLPLFRQPRAAPTGAPGATTNQPLETAPAGGTKAIEASAPIDPTTALASGPDAALQPLPLDTAISPRTLRKYAQYLSRKSEEKNKYQTTGGPYRPTP